MRILVAGKMGPGTLEAKIEPLSKIERVEKIFFLRKSDGLIINKTEYIQIPKYAGIRIIRLITTPLLLIYFALKKRTDILISYHIIPYAFFVSFVGFITSKPFVICQTGLIIQKKSSNPFMGLLLGNIFKKAFQINCPGTSSKLFWQEKYPTIKEKFHVLHSTVDTERYTPDFLKVKEYDLLFLGRLHKIKNIDLIIEAFKKVIEGSESYTKLKFQIVGGGPEMEPLKKLVENLHLANNIEFTGFVADPLPFIRKSKYTIMASDSEGLPSGMMQAMSCGIIPITNLVGNISDIVENRISGFTFNQLDVTEIAKTIEEAINIDDKKYTKMSLKCREIIVKNHSHIHAKNKWIELLNQI